MFLNIELDDYRKRGRLPAKMSKRFLRALKTFERKTVANALRTQLVALVDESGQPDPATLLLIVTRLCRVQNVRREKGEL